MRNIRNFIVVGGGTAGLISALILKQKYPGKSVKIIESSKVGIVGVGESSTEHWAEFCKFCGIDQLGAIFNANATLKNGVFFDNWGEKDFMHGIDNHASTLDGSYFDTYGYLIANKAPHHKLQHKNIWDNKVPLYAWNNRNSSSVNQYQFDTHALNKWLHDICRSRGIDIIIDDLTGANLDHSGNVVSVNGAAEHCADFFIDCSGFARLLINKVLKQKWVSYSEYLPLNSAITFATDEMEEYNAFTKCTARDYGWNWTIPTQTRTGNGYVFCDGFIGRDQALAEMEKCYGRKLDVGKHFRFDPGRVEKSWVNNVCAIGLSQSFVEPLEATSIGSAIQSMFCFINMLPSWDIDAYNQNINDIFDNIVDYVQAHYLTKREDTPFWQEVKYHLKLTPGLSKLLDLWKNRLPRDVDITCSWGMFSAVNYIPVLYGLDWFDTDVIANEYAAQEFSHDPGQLQEQSWDTLWVGHKQFLKMLVANNGTCN